MIISRSILEYWQYFILFYGCVIVHCTYVPHVLLFVCFGFCLLSFLGCTRGIWRFPGQGSSQSCCCQPRPEPQQRQIRALSVIYAIVHSNAGSLTHWSRPGIEPETSWFLVGFVSAVPRRELLYHIFLIQLSVDGHLGGFHNLATAITTAVTLGCQVSFQISVFSWETCFLIWLWHFMCLASCLTSV